eukprot:351594-Chlamydomonas_euryale.AAC.2
MEGWGCSCMRAHLLGPAPSLRHKRLTLPRPLPRPSQLQAPAGSPGCMRPIVCWVDGESRHTRQRTAADACPGKAPQGGSRASRPARQLGWDGG